MSGGSELTYGQSTEWQPERPRLRVFPLIVSWLAMGVALMVAAGLLPGVSIDDFWGALIVAAIVAALNAVIPPILAALRLPLTLVLGFENVADIMVGSFYDPELEEGCAFEELICFHGGLGGLQTRPFILHPSHLEIPPGPILGAASVHGILAGWRKTLQGGPIAAVPAHAERTPAAGVAEQPVAPSE